MSKRYLVGLDLGTTNIKGILMTVGGKTAADHSMHVEYIKGTDGSVEYDAKEFFLMTAKLIKTLADKADGRIEGLSIVSASGNTVLLDENMRSIRPAISWLDKRFTNEAKKVLGETENYYNIIGWPFNNTFPLAHLSWLKLNEPVNYNAAGKVCMMTDYVKYQLSGKLATNPSTACLLYTSDAADDVSTV